VKDNIAFLKRNYLKKLQYVAMRHVFPITTDQRAIATHSNRIFANSIPKAGTNLLSRLLRLMPNVIPSWTYHIDETIPGFSQQLSTVRKGQVITAHLPWSSSLARQLDQLAFRKILIVRDMRDVAVSGVYYITHMDFAHPLHGYFNTLSNDDERLMAVIKGVESMHYFGGRKPPLWKNDFYRAFLPWLDDPECLLVRFEDLVGKSGGGDAAVQEATVRKVALHIGANLDPSQLQHICSSLFFNKSRTFRKGQIGDWNSHFNEEHKRVFKEKAGDILIRMGYEKSNDW